MMAVGTSLHTVDQPQDEPPERRTDDHAAGHGEQEGRRNRADGKAVGRDGSDGEAIDQQRAGVIQQALAFEDGQDAMRRSQLTQHGGCGRGVGWRDDGAERNRRRPWHGGHQRARHHGDGDGREAHGKDDQTGDRCPVVPEVSRRRVVGRVEQDGRDEERQGELGQDGERRRAWNEREDRAAERQKHGIGCADAARHGGQHDGGEDQADEDFEFSHGQPAAILERLALLCSSYVSGFSRTSRGPPARLRQGYGGSAVALREGGKADATGCESRPRPCSFWHSKPIQIEDKSPRCTENLRRSFLRSWRVSLFDSGHAAAQAGDGAVGGRFSTARAGRYPASPSWPPRQKGESSARRSPTGAAPTKSVRFPSAECASPSRWMGSSRRPKR